MSAGRGAWLSYRRESGSSVAACPSAGRPLPPDLVEVSCPAAPKGAGLVSVRTEDDVAQPLWEAVEALEETGVRDTGGCDVLRAAPAAARSQPEDEAADRVNVKPSRGSGQGMPAELEDARIACLERAGITLEYGLGQTARSRFWWEQHPDGGHAGRTRSRIARIAHDVCAPC